MFIHPGIGKTGTTAFQNSYLANSPYVHCCGRPSHKTNDYPKVRWMLTQAEDFEFDHVFLKQWFANQRIAAKEKGKIPVLSDETLCGKGAGCRQLSIFFSRLARCCPESQIVVTIRNQPDLIKSFWFGHASHLKNAPSPYKGKYVSLNNWLDWQFDQYRRNQGQLLLYNFNRLESVINHYFPTESIFFVPCERLRVNNEGNYSAIMSRILGVPELELAESMRVRVNCSSGRTNPYFKKSKGLGYLFPSFIKRSGNLISSANSLASVLWNIKPEEFNDEDLKKLGDIYGHGNQSLGEKQFLNLKDRGYPWVNAGG